MNTLRFFFLVFDFSRTYYGAVSRSACATEGFKLYTLQHFGQF